MDEVLSYVSGLEGWQVLVIGFGSAVLLCFIFGLPLVRRRYERKLHDSKKQFIGLASHYLLTPITIIQTAVTRLQEADTTLVLEERQKLYEAIARGQQRLWIIAEQIVLIQEIDNGSFELRRDVANVADIVSTAAAAMNVFLQHKEMEVTITNQTKEVQETRLDARRMKQALIAILDNAVKFSPDAAKIDIRIWQRGNMFTVEIEDHGIGMPDEVIRRLGEKFFRGSDIYNFDYEGLGLGLHIAYAILRAHQGVVSYRSKEGRGTVAVVEIPVN